MQVYTDKGNTKKSTGRPGYSHLLCYCKSAVGAELPRTRTQQRKDHNVQSKSRLTTSSLTTSPSRAAAVRLYSEDGPSGPVGQTAGVLLSSPPQDGVAREAEPDEIEANTSTISSSSGSSVPIRCTYRTSLFAVPDIFFRGEMLWPKGIGLDCCYVGVEFLRTVAGAKGIIDPFAGQGTVLAMANALGVPAIGVEISPKRCRKANNLSIDLALISPYLRKMSMDEVEERAGLAKSGAKKAKNEVIEDDDI